MYTVQRCENIARARAEGCQVRWWGRYSSLTGFPLTLKLYASEMLKSLGFRIHQMTLREMMREEKLYLVAEIPLERIDDSKQYTLLLAQTVVK